MTYLRLTAAANAKMRWDISPHQAYDPCSESTPARPHPLTSVFTHSDHVFRGIPFFLVPGIRKFVIDLIQNMARCTWPFHLSRRQRGADVISLMPSFCSSEPEGISSLSLMPQIQQIMAQRRCSLGLFGPHVLLPWSIAEQTQVSYTLPCILGERCRVVRTGKSFLDFPQGTQHLATMALSQPPPEHCHTVTVPTRAQHITLVAESGFHIKHGAVNIHFSHSSAIDGSRLTLTPGTDIVFAGCNCLTVWPHYKLLSSQQQAVRDIHLVYQATDIGTNKYNGRWSKSNRSYLRLSFLHLFF